MLCNCLAQQSCLPLAPPWGYLKPNLVTKCSVSLVRQWYVLRRCLTCVFLPDLTGDHTCCCWNLGLLAQEAGPGSQNSLGGPEPSQGEEKRLENRAPPGTSWASLPLRTCGSPQVPKSLTEQYQTHCQALNWVRIFNGNTSLEFTYCWLGTKALEMHSDFNGCTFHWDT